MGTKLGAEKQKLTHHVVCSENHAFLTRETETNNHNLLNNVDLCYIDPPYNTGSNTFTYHDKQDTPAWLSFMEDRLQPLTALSKPTGVVMVSIDDSEVHTLRLLMDQIFGKNNFIAQIVVDGGSSKNNARFLSVTHEYILVYARDKNALMRSGAKWRKRREGINLLLKEHEKLIRQHGEDYETITAALKQWVKTVPLTPRLKVFTNADSRGLYTYADLSAPGKNGGTYDVLHPVTGEPCVVPSRGWGLKQCKMRELLDDDMIIFGTDETQQPLKKLYLQDKEDQVQKAILSYPARTTTHLLEKLLRKRTSFSHPKNVDMIRDLIKLSTPDDAVILDYFAGSGTTGHAVLQLNAMSSSSQRRFVLVTSNENRIYEEVTVPRIQEVVKVLKKKHSSLTDHIVYGEPSTFIV